MRLLFIGGGHRFWGMEQALLTLETSLVARGHHCAHVTCGWSDGVFAEGLAAAGALAVPLKLGSFYLTKPLWTLDTLKELPGAAKNLRRLVREFDPDVIVHLNHRAFALTYLLLSDFEGKHVFREAVTPDARRFVDRLAYTAVVSKCCLIMANSSDTLSALERLGVPENRLALVENGLAKDVLKPVAHRANGAARIGIVGQIIRNKGHDVLWQALGRLLKQDFDFRLIVVGEGNADFVMTLKQQAIDWQFEHLITWAGVVRDKQAIYEQIDMLAIPSRSESAAWVAIEAGAAALPVVASRVGGLPSIVADGETGILVTPESIDELADGLARLIVDPDLRKAMGEAGRRRVETRFTADRMAENFAQVIEAVI